MKLKSQLAYKKQDMEWLMCISMLYSETDYTTWLRGTAGLISRTYI